MDDSNINQPAYDLDQIVTILENIESRNLKDDSETMELIDRITDPKLELIESLINILVLDKKNHSQISTILKIFIKLNYYKRDKVFEKLQEHPLFLRSLISYVSENDIKLVSAESFIIIGEIFSKCDYEPMNSEKFINALLNSISIIENDSTLTSIIKIITNINYNIDNVQENNFLKLFLEHENSRFFAECLLRMINLEEDKGKLYRYLQCFIDITNITKSSYFYSTDLESFINIAIKKLESTYNDKLRYFILSLLERVCYYDDYYKEKYKINVLIELMEDYETNNEVDEYNQKIASSILENIRNHLNNH